MTALVIVALILFAVGVMLRPPKHEWHRSWRPDLMQRKIGGKWQYRKETEDEAWRHLQDDAW
jgi:hypothetical protein